MKLVWVEHALLSPDGTGESVKAPARDGGKQAKVIDNHDAAVYIRTHCH